MLGTKLLEIIDTDCLLDFEIYQLEYLLPRETRFSGHKSTQDFEPGQIFKLTLEKLFERVINKYLKDVETLIVWLL